MTDVDIPRENFIFKGNKIQGYSPPLAFRDHNQKKGNCTGNCRFQVYGIRIGHAME